MDLGITNNFSTKQVIWVDYDNDGDKDFLATSIYGLNRFYLNNDDLTFTDITSTSGLFINDLYTYGASFGDIDNDGDLDLFISNRDDISENQRNYLYKNDNGFFVDITEIAGIHMNSELSFCASFFDYNNDGFQDIYVANDKSYKNRLYKNNGNLTFEDVSDISGAAIEIDAMSTTIGDYNNDGWFDIYVTNTIDGNYLLKNNKDGTFTNVATATGTIFNSFAWGAVFLDADNDADLDLYVSGLLDGSVPGRLPSAFYENIGNDIFVVPTGIGFENDNRMSFSNAIGDFNNDGLPDIIVLNDSESNFLWENKTTNLNKWLRVKLQGTQSNRDGIGSKIEIRANGKTQFRYTLCGEGYLGQNSTSEFFGLADAEIIEYIKITWLSGMVDILYNVQPNQTLNIVEGENVLNTSDNSQFDFAIYPNPSNGVFKVQLRNTQHERINLGVYNIFGKKVYSKMNLNENQGIDLTKLTKGVYYCKLSCENAVSFKKVIYN